jgi:hypothetical protein
MVLNIGFLSKLIMAYEFNVCCQKETQLSLLNNRTLIVLQKVKKKVLLNFHFYFCSTLPTALVSFY